MSSSICALNQTKAVDTNIVNNQNSNCKFQINFKNQLSKYPNYLPCFDFEFSFIGIYWSAAGWQTTGLQQIVMEWQEPTLMVSADEMITPSRDWLVLQWEKARLLEKGYRLLESQNVDDSFKHGKLV